jgi:hypothetical protein
MNKHEIQTIRQEAQRFMKDMNLSIVEDAVKLESSFTNVKGESIYLFISKRRSTKKFTLLIPVESTGLLAVNNTLSILQKVLQTYGLILTQEAVIMEESKLPLHQRIRNMTQALISIDGIIRLWRVTYATKSETIESFSDTANISTSQ